MPSNINVRAVVLRIVTSLTSVPADALHDGVRLGDWVNEIYVALFYSECSTSLSISHHTTIGALIRQTEGRLAGTWRYEGVASLPQDGDWSLKKRAF